MKTRIALIALLVLAAAARADEADVARRQADRAALAAQKQALLASRDAMKAAAETRRLVLRRAGSGPEGTARTETTVVAPRRARLELESFGGEIVVSGWDRDQVRVVADHAPGARVRVIVQPAAVVVQARGEVSVPAEKGRPARARTVTIPVRVDYRLNVPRGMSLRLSGLDSPIRVDGVQGDVSAETMNGPIWVRGGRGAIRVEAVRGAVEVVDARGVVEASSMSEDVVLRDVEGRVRVETVQGNLELARVLSEAVEASTVSGNLRYEGSLRPGGAYRFETHSGDLTIVLPERPDAAVTVESYDGSFQSSFPVPARRPRSGEDFEFLLGDGRAELELASFSGAIRLLRAGEAPPAPAAPRQPGPAKPAPPAPPKAR